MRALFLSILCLLATACASDGMRQPRDPPPRAESVVPGTIHVAHTLEERVPKAQLIEAVELY